MRWKFILGLLTTCAVLMSMSYTMLIPFLPMYQRHHGTDLGRAC